MVIKLFFNPRITARLKYDPVVMGFNMIKFINKE
jgi:hypothetical protein